MIKKIKELRVHIDGLTKLTKLLKVESKEVKKSIDSLFLAKAWLGKILPELGDQNPYKPGYKTSSDIQKTADVAEFNSENPSDWIGFPTAWWEKANHIEKVDWLREDIKKLDTITDPYRDYEDNLIWENFSSKAMACLFNTNRHLCECRFWLGAELQRIKEL